MKQIIYAMQFKGQAGPGASPTIMKATTNSPSCTLTTVIGTEGMHGACNRLQAARPRSSPR